MHIHPTVAGRTSPLLLSTITLLALLALALMLKLPGRSAPSGIAPLPAVAGQARTTRGDQVSGRIQNNQALVPCDASVLIEAIDQANSHEDVTTLDLASNCTYSLTTTNNLLAGANGLPSIETRVIIQGNGATIERNRDPYASTPDFRIFHIAETGTLTIRSVTIRGGITPVNENDTGYGGGGIHNSGTLFIENSTITENATNGGLDIYGSGHGGGIYNDNGLVTVISSTISHNATGNGAPGTVDTNGGDGGNGGGVYNLLGMLHLRESLVVDNHTGDSGTNRNGGNGGGIANLEGTVSITRTTVQGNHTGTGGHVSRGHGGDGGGIHNLGTFHVISSTITENRTGNGGFDVGEASNGEGGKGGGIYNGTNSVLTITSSSIDDNATGRGSTAGPAGSGGGVYINGGNVSMVLSRVSSNRTGTAGSSNTTPYAGGGLVNRGNLTLSDCQVSGNRSTSAGGGISNRGTLALIDSVVAENQAALRGGGIAHEEGSGRMVASTVEENTTGTTGGGLDNRGAFQVISSTLRTNTASTGGGVANAGTGDLRVASSTIHSNSASSFGGGVSNAGSSTLEVARSTISGNTTSGNGGGLSNRDEAVVSISSTTINRNSASFGGGVSHYSGTVVLINTILGGNRVDEMEMGSGPDCEGTLTLQGHNLIQRVGACTIETGEGEEDGGGNIIGEEPWLAPLADYGGPTWTHALHESSPAADAGVCIAGQPTDQRGMPRPDPTSGVCDIGAFEAYERLPDPPALSLEKSVSRLSARPGTNLAYTVELSAANGTVMTFVTDTLPSGLSFVSSSTQGVTYDQETSQVRYSSLITPGSPTLLIYRAIVGASVEGGSSLMNHIRATVEDRMVEDAVEVVIQSDLPTPIPTSLPTPEPTPSVSPTPSAEPALTAIAPNTVNEDDGEVDVTITGEHLSEPEQVTIGGVELQGVVLVDDQTIRATLPAGLLGDGTYDVVVVIDGESLVLAEAFTVEAGAINDHRSVYLPLVRR